MIVRKCWHCQNQFEFWKKKSRILIPCKFRKSHQISLNVDELLKRYKTKYPWGAVPSPREVRIKKISNTIRELSLLQCPCKVLKKDLYCAGLFQRDKIFLRDACFSDMLWLLIISSFYHYLIIIFLYYQTYLEPSTYLLV